jgi:hypothetical protein
MNHQKKQIELLVKEQKKFNDEIANEFIEIREQARLLGDTFDTLCSQRKASVKQHEHIYMVLCNKGKNART